MGWTPLFSKIVDSSLWSEPDYVVKIFLTMLAKKDSAHIVRGNAFEIGTWSRKTEAEAIEALKVLASPDKRRIEPQPYDGRRIEKVDGGWLILNGQHYEELMRKANRATYQREKQREYRLKRKIEDGEALPKRKPKPMAGEGSVRNGEESAEKTLRDLHAQDVERLKAAGKYHGEADVDSGDHGGVI